MWSSPPRRWRKKALAGAVFLLILAVLLAGVFLFRSRPETFEGGAEVVYTDGDGTYHVLLSFSSGIGVVTDPEAEFSAVLAEGMESAVPSQLYIYREGTNEPVWQAFLEKIGSWSVETTPREGGVKMAFSQPGHNDDYPYAALASEVFFTADNGTNEIVWTLNLKNGDTIRLRQSVHAALQDTVRYSSETAPMDTAEDLQALLDAIGEEVPGGTLVELYLPPVVYEGELRFSNHPFRIYGGSDGDAQTTFSGLVTLGPANPWLSEIFDVRFAGGGGTGLTAYSGVILYGCTVTGWDTGAAAQNGAWIGAEGCCFADNGIGLEFNSDSYYFSTSAFPDNRFSGNETGVYFHRLAGSQLLSFAGCTFSRNGTDIRNETEHRLDLSGTVFE